MTSEESEECDTYKCKSCSGTYQMKEWQAVRQNRSQIPVNWCPECDTIFRVKRSVLSKVISFQPQTHRERIRYLVCDKCKSMVIREHVAVRDDTCFRCRWKLDDKLKNMAELSYVLQMVRKVTFVGCEPSKCYSEDRMNSLFARSSNEKEDDPLFVRDVLSRTSITGKPLRYLPHSDQSSDRAVLLRTDRCSRKGCETSSCRRIEHRNHLVRSDEVEESIKILAESQSIPGQPRAIVSRETKDLTIPTSLVSRAPGRVLASPVNPVPPSRSDSFPRLSYSDHTEMSPSALVLISDICRLTAELRNKMRVLRRLSLDPQHTEKCVDMLEKCREEMRIIAEDRRLSLAETALPGSAVQGLLPGGIGEAILKDRIARRREREEESHPEEPCPKKPRVEEPLRSRFLQEDIFPPPPPTIRSRREPATLLFDEHRIWDVRRDLLVRESTSVDFSVSFQQLDLCNYLSRFLEWSKILEPYGIGE